MEDFTPNDSHTGDEFTAMLTSTSGHVVHTVTQTTTLKMSMKLKSSHIFSGARTLKIFSFRIILEQIKHTSDMECQMSATLVYGSVYVCVT